MTSDTASKSIASMRCRNCGYDLRSLSQSRCPECGRVFNPARPWTYLDKPVSGRGRLGAAFGGVVLIVSPLLTAWLLDVGVLQIPVVFWPVLIVGPALLVTGFAIECRVLRTSSEALFGRLPWIEHERAFLVAFVLSVAVMVAGLGTVLLRIVDRLSF
jgi:rubredoxin